VRFRGLFLVGLCVALAGCGGSSGAANQHVRGVSSVERRCGGSKVAAKREHERRQLTADLRRLRLATATVKGYTQNGNPALNKALDRFQLDIAVESLSVHERSRFIDRAASIVAARCYLCFQALEANRPIAAGAKLVCG
jgi:hypothetical protein